jgi:hypothetical protein
MVCDGTFLSSLIISTLFFTLPSMPIPKWI